MVSNRHRKGSRVLAVDPHIRRVGVAFFEGQSLVDWSQPSMRQDEPAKRVRRLLIPGLIALLDRFNPDVLLLPGVGPSRSHRSRHITEAIRVIAREARTRDVPVYEFSDKEVKHAFRDTDGRPAKNKPVINRAIVGRFPELKMYLPRARRPYDPESHYTPLFNAAALYGAWLDLLGRDG